MRKPLESLSPYYRILSQICFENPSDKILDMCIVDNNDNLTPGSQAYFIVSIENKYIVFIALKLGASNKNKIDFTFWVNRIPENLQVTEAVFHIDAFTKRNEG